LSPWDIAAGALMITEAGGLVGNFTGESDYLYQREVVAGNPKIYAQLVQVLAPFTRVIKDEPAPAVARPHGPTPVAALAHALTPADAPTAPPRKAVRLRKAEPPASKDDAPF
ncbi:MAG: inositol monophosphatase, partial [Rhizobacter sp.]|nr:inositol monophosphatase [Rhizobacter sp.]